MWITYGQWLHMKITSSADAPLKSASETSFPFVSGKLKSGAFVPSGSMVEGVKAIPEFEPAQNFSQAAKFKFVSLRVCNFNGRHRGKKHCLFRSRNAEVR